MSRRLSSLAGLIAGATWVAVLASGSYFTTDDHVFFAQEKELPFGWSFLAEPANDHFSPWHRLHDHIVTSFTDQGWWLALVISIGWYVAAVLAFGLLVRRLVGDHPAGWLATLAFAFSPAFVEGAQWWGLGAQLYPQLALTLVTLLFGLRWLQTRERWALAAALVAYALALCAFPKALLAVPLLALVLYLRPAAPRPGRSDLPLWVGMGLLSGGYLLVISGGRYYRFIDDAPAATVGLWVKYLAAGWGEGVAPLALAGTVDDALGVGNLAVVAVANLAVVALIVLTVRSAALAWLGAGIVVLGTLVLSGGARLGGLGVEFVALDPRYNFEGSMALMLAGAMAARARWPQLRPSPWLAVPALLILVLAVDGGLRRERVFPGAAHRAYFDTFARTLAANPGVDIADAAAPDRIVDGSIVPYNQLSRILPQREPGVRVGTLAGPPAVVDPTGRVLPIELETIERLDPGCTPLAYDLELPDRPDGVVITLRRRDAAPVPVPDVYLTADTGLPDGHLVAGIPFPATFSFPVTFDAGRRDARIVLAAGPVSDLTVGSNGEVCFSEIRIERFPLEG